MKQFHCFDSRGISYLITAILFAALVAIVLQIKRPGFVDTKSWALFAVQKNITKSIFLGKKNCLFWFLNWNTYVLFTKYEKWNVFFDIWIKWNCNSELFSFLDLNNSRCAQKKAFPDFALILNSQDPRKEATKAAKFFYWMNDYHFQKVKRSTIAKKKRAFCVNKKR